MRTRQVLLPVIAAVCLTLAAPAGAKPPPLVLTLGSHGPAVAALQHREVLLVVAHHRTARAIHISSARPGYVTPTGSFRVIRRERMSWSVPYSVWMPYALYFTGGYAVHGYSEVPAYPRRTAACGCRCSRRPTCTA